IAEKQCRSIAGCNVGDLTDRPYAAMMFWTAKVHERAGTNPFFPLFHRQAIEENLEQPSDTSFSEAIEAQDFAERVWESFKVKTKPGKHTFGPVKGILVRLKDEGKPNV